MTIWRLPMSGRICIKEWFEESKKVAELAGAGKDEWGEMDRAYRQGGYPAVSRFQLKQELGDLSKGRFVPALSIADSYAVLGDGEEAFRWLAKAYEERDSSMILLPVNPNFEPLHGDRRYRDVVRRLGLEGNGTGSAKGRDSAVYAGN